MDLFTETPADEDDGSLWADGKSIDEVAFCEAYLARHPMKCIHGELYDLDGRVDTGRFENELYNMLKPYATANVAKIVAKLMDAIKIAAWSQELPIDTDHIHFSNGTYNLADRSFTTDKMFCLNRLPVRYDADAPEPSAWLAFLDDLLYPEDIRPFQEFMGYVLIPSNRAQAMMLIIGDGGEGKSRIPLVLRAILGDNMNLYSLQKLATDKFARADQAGKLMMVDDDMNTDALPATNILKTIVTLESQYDLERKNKQSFQGTLYVRLLALGNGTLSALYDKSDGFYRRQLVIKVRPKPEGRLDDHNLIDKLLAEKEGILQWFLEGLHRVVDNGFDIKASERMKQNVEEMKKHENNILDFYESTGYIRFEKGTHALSRQIYVAYRKWCEDNLEKALSERTFSTQLKRDEKRLGIQYDKNIDVSGGKKARGYHGLHVQVNTEDYRVC